MSLGPSSTRNGLLCNNETNLTTRKEGIELFRCVSMILIVMLHVLGQGGVLAYADEHGEQFRVAWLLETMGYCSVDCFALISGFVNHEHEFKFSRFVLRWLEVFFWLVVPFLITLLFFPEISVEQYLAETIAPLSTKSLWYFNAYVLLMPFIPIMNCGIERLGKRNLERILLFLFFMTSILETFSGSDIFVLGFGYSGIWLIILFIFGAYYRLYGIPNWAKWYITVPVFLASSVTAWMLEMHKDDLVNAGLIERSDYLFSLLDRFVGYTSPFMILMALALLMFFAKVRLRSPLLRRTFALLGKGTFGVFLIHVGPIIWYHFLHWRYKGYALFEPLKLIIWVVGTSVLLFLLFDLLSLIRVMIFQYCGINRFVKKIFGE